MVFETGQSKNRGIKEGTTVCGATNNPGKCNEGIYVKKKQTVQEERSAGRKGGGGLAGRGRLLGIRRGEGNAGTEQGEETGQQQDRPRYYWEDAGGCGSSSADRWAGP